jgi:outer membrane lipoprotein-sorting protein
MAQIPARGPGRKAARYGVPVAVVAVTAATIGLVPALADSGSPDLPKISAQNLIAKMAASKTDEMSGTVKVSTDLGLPALPGLGGGAHRGGMFGGDGHQPKAANGGKAGATDKAGKKADSPAAPRRELMKLASGEHTLRVATDGPEKQRISVIEDAAGYTFVHNGRQIWTYDSASDSAFHGTLPQHAARGAHHAKRHGKATHENLAELTPQQAARQALKAARTSTNVSVDGTTHVAGRDAYQLVLEPKKSAHSTIGSVRIAVDADKGVPLKFTVLPAGGGSPAVDIAYTSVDFGKPKAGTFDFTPPKGAHVTERTLGAGRRHAKGDKSGAAHQQAMKKKLKKLHGLNAMDVLGDGWGSVATLHLPDKARHGGHGAQAGKGLDSPRAQKLLDSFTKKVKGDFGTGRVFHTKLVNALLTDDGTVYVGAVTKQGLIDAANAAH